ncbi:MAG: metal-dependent hydrolase [Anaerolineae bacterium]
MLFGHLAVSVLQHRYLKADLSLVVAGGIFPDIVDKTLCQVLHLTPSGRMFGHTLVGVVLSTAVVDLVGGRRAARGWALGYLGHLLGDAAGFVPWLYPFARYDFPSSPPGLLEIVRHALAKPDSMRWDVALSVWAICAWL